MRSERSTLTAAIALLVLMATGTAGNAAGFGNQDVQEHPACAHCNMDRAQWSHTRHLVAYRDGHSEGTCSLRCVALSLDSNFGRTPVRILAADAASEEDLEPLYSVEDVIYVLDPTQRGTMTARRKWAYHSKIQALRARGREGRLMEFRQALHAAFDDIADRALGAYEDARKGEGRRRR